MAIIVTVETLLLALIALLVAGLLRSHAEILRRLAVLDDDEVPASARAPADAPPRGGLPDHLPPARDAATPAFDVVGTTLAGDPVKVAVLGARTPTLLAFLSSGCLSCEGFWNGLAPPVRPTIPGDARIVVVTKDSSHESPSRLRELAPSDLPVVMSSDAWERYGVQGSPYFILAGRSGEVQGEGTASNWTQVLSLLRDAFEDAEIAAATGVRRSERGPERLRRADEELTSSGIGAGHPSLYGIVDLTAAKGPSDART